nr:single-stranded DNA-binding protein [Candidatus Palauibacterales bacterium]
VAWERLAEICERYLSKGDRVYVEGRIEYRQWEGQDGQTRYTTEIRAREMIMLGGRGDAGSTAARGTRPEAGRESEDDDYSDFSNEALMGEDDLPF